MTNIEEKDAILGNMVTAVNLLEQCSEFACLVPEVRVNLAYALPEAASRQDVAAIEGRITVVGGLPRASGLPAFGASDHMARLIIEIRKYDVSINAGINFKCNEGIIETVKNYCNERQLLFGWIDRSREPVEVIGHDGASMPWKIAELVRSSGGVPRLFYEGRGWGKEPLFVTVGKNAVEVASIAVDLSKHFKAGL
ncbi:MAG: thiamine-phosphate synthase family protein [Dehalococcoidales bacterium]|nr:thiamine-phosphate synthase family protein [Dehalococcoidales bacterium]MDD4322508.1 thiamine-phosphate synthase family protein [Dehalococcoidales bacterium]